LKYDYVSRLKPSVRRSYHHQWRFHGSFIGAGANGLGLDGVMLGRAAYHNPSLLAEVERALINPAWRIPETWQIIEQWSL